MKAFCWLALGTVVALLVWLAVQDVLCQREWRREMRRLGTNGRDAK